MLVISRFRYAEGEVVQARSDLTTCVEGLRAQPGLLDATVGRAVDDPTLWVLQTSWVDVGSYRRALSSFDVKVNVVPLLSRALDEPSAYEVIVGTGAGEPNQPKPRGSA